MRPPFDEFDYHCYCNLYHFGKMAGRKRRLNVYSLRLHCHLIMLTSLSCFGYNTHTHAKQITNNNIYLDNIVNDKFVFICRMQTMLLTYYVRSFLIWLALNRFFQGNLRCFFCFPPLDLKLFFL